MSGMDNERRLQEYEERMRQLDDKMLDSSRRSRQKLEEAAQIGAETMVELDEQGEKLTRTERRLDDIDQDLRTSQRTIRQIRSVFGGVVNWFTTDKLATTPSTASTTEAPRRTQEVSRPPAAASSGARHSQPPSRQAQATQYRSAQEKEVDENLQAMSGTLSMLKDIGQDMGTVLEDQSRQIDRMSGRVGTLDAKVQDVKNQTRRLA